MEELDKKLALVARCTKTPIVITDKYQRIEWINESFSKVSGYTLEECKGLIPGHFLQGEGTDKNTVLRIKEKIKSKKSFSEEILNYTKDGHPYWVRIIVDPIFDDNKEIINFIAVQEDITELKRKEQILLDSQEIAQVGSWLFEVNTGKVSWSPELFNIFEVNINEKDILPVYLSRIHKEDIKELQNIIDNSIKEAKPYRFFHRIVCPSGVIKYIYCVGRPIRSKNGDVIKIQGISQDLTDQKSAEMEIYKAKRQAEEASKAKSSFLAMISHEIRTPMNSILGMSQLLLQNNSNLSEEQKDMLSTIKTSSNNLLKIVNDILDFSKVESGNINLEEDIINIKSCIDDIINLFKPQCMEKKITIEYLNKNYDLPNILADETRLKQVLINIIGNSLKFTSEGQITIQTKVLSRDDKNIDLEFRIKDTGIGIDKDNIGKLFKPFSQISNHTNRNTGTGLGLVITQKIIEMYNGKIKVESELNKGTEFFFNFKFKITESNESLINKEEQFILDSQLSEKIPLKILVADDNQMNQKVLRMFLSKMGYKSSFVENGLEVLEKIKNESFDLIFMDIHMPDLDGLETTKEIITIYGENRPKIVGVTASAFKEDKKACYDAGMDGYLSKPININKIQELIIKLYQKV